MKLKTLCVSLPTMVVDTCRGLGLVGPHCTVAHDSIMKTFEASSGGCMFQLLSIFMSLRLYHFQYFVGDSGTYCHCASVDT